MGIPAFLQTSNARYAASRRSSPWNSKNMDVPSAGAITSTGPASWKNSSVLASGKFSGSRSFLTTTSSPLGWDSIVCQATTVRALPDHFGQRLQPMPAVADTDIS